MPVHSQYRRDTICAYGKARGSDLRTENCLVPRVERPVLVAPGTVCGGAAEIFFPACMLWHQLAQAPRLRWVVAWITSQLRFFTFLRNWFNIIYHGRLSCLRPKFIATLTSRALPSRAKVKSHSKSTPLHFKRKMSLIGPFSERPIEPAQRNFCESNKVL